MDLSPHPQQQEPEQWVGQHWERQPPCEERTSIYCFFLFILLNTEFAK